MNIIERFDITKNDVLEIVIPDFKDKYNYYYEPTELLNKFDVVSVILKSNERDFVVMNEIIQDIACSFRYHLKKTLNNQSPLPANIPLGGLNLLYSKDDYKNYWQDEALSCVFTIDYQQYWLWSSAGKMQSWMYNRDGKLYLEIGEIYAVSSYDERNDQEFEKYIDDYKPLLFTEISRSQAQEWLEKCERIIRDIDSEYIFNHINKKSDAHT